MIRVQGDVPAAVESGIWAEDVRCIHMCPRTYMCTVNMY